MKMLSKDYSIALKGIAAVFVMLGHFLPEGTPGIVQFFFYGPIWVGVFFFYSGYGLRYSVNNDRNYLKGFVGKKIIGIWVPFAIAEAVYMTCQISINGAEYNLSDVLGGILGYKLSNDVLWYVVELLILYIFFYLIEISGIGKKKKACYGLWLFIYVLFLLLSVLFDIGTWWFISTSAFLMGIWTADNGNILKGLMQNGIVKAVVVIAAVLTYTGAQVGQIWGVTVGNIPVTYFVTALTMLTVPFFILSVMIFAERISCENRLLLFIGSISYEIYLYHICVKLLISRYMTEIVNGLELVIIEGIITILISVLAFEIKKRIKFIGKNGKNG